MVVHNIILVRETDDQINALQATKLYFQLYSFLSVLISI